MKQASMTARIHTWLTPKPPSKPMIATNLSCWSVGWVSVGFIAIRDGQPTRFPVFPPPYHTYPHWEIRIYDL